MGLVAAGEDRRGIINSRKVPLNHVLLAYFTDVSSQYLRPSSGNVPILYRSKPRTMAC